MNRGQALEQLDDLVVEHGHHDDITALRTIAAQFERFDRLAAAAGAVLDADGDDAYVAAAGQLAAAVAEVLDGAQ